MEKHAVASRDDLKYKVVFVTNPYDHPVVINEFVLENIRQVCCEEGWVNFWSGDVVKFHVQTSALIYFELIEAAPIEQTKFRASSTLLMTEDQSR
jgi:hypothetical protein